MMRKFLFVIILALACGHAQAQTFSGGNGSASDPYKISKPADFEELSTWSCNYRKSFDGQYFKLTNDVTFAEEYWNQIGTEVTPFQGNFDGDGHALRGVWIIAEAGTNYGVFSIVGEHSVIKNLTLIAPNIITSVKWTGFLASDLSGTIENCHVVNADYTVSRSAYIGGLVGYVRPTGVIQDCSFSGQINASNSVGAIAGYCAGHISNCTSTATITSTATGLVYLGGITYNLRNEGAATNARIDNCTFSGTIIGGSNNYVGGISAQLSHSTVTNSRNQGTLIANGYTGGIVGIANESVINRCANEKPITDIYINGSTAISTVSSACLAGICGNATATTIDQCWNGGTIATAYYSAAGIVGNFISGTIRDCYNAGGIMARMSKTAGGIAAIKAGNGDGGSIVNCLSYGSLLNSPTARVRNCELTGGSAENPSQAALTGNYYDNQVTGWDVETEGGMTTRQLTSGTTPDGLNPDIWTCASGMYPRLTWDKENELAQLCAIPFYLSDGERMGRVKTDFTMSNAANVTWSATESASVSISGSNAHVTRASEAQIVTLTSHLGDYTRDSYIVIYPHLFSGEGTANDPYLINNSNDLKTLALATNEQQLDFCHETLRVTANIDLNGQNYVPVSQADINAFGGTLEGDGHSIKNWAVNTLSSGEKNVALIGWVSPTGTVRNLTIDNSCSFNTCGYFAPIVYNLAGTLSGCANLADIKTSVGQIAGIAYHVNEGAKLSDCFNEGTLTATATSATNMAGIAVINHGEIQNCDNAGNLIAPYATAKNLGGLVTENHGRISNCLNTGSLNGGTILGGLVAAAKGGSEVSNSLCTGIITPSGEVSQVGAVVGTVDGQAMFSQVKFDKQITIYNNVAQPGIEGCATQQLTTAQIMGDGTAWVYSEGRYPQLSRFATLPTTLLASLPVTFADGETRRDFSAVAQLAQYDGLQWSLAAASDFSVQGSQLIAPSNVAYTSDVLIARMNNRSRQIPLGTMGNAFDGQGTLESPWLINTPDDLVKLSQQVNESQLPYLGKHFSITADLDMSGINFVPIAAGTTNKFCGIIDGNGHTIANLNIARGTAENNGLVGYMGAGGAISDLTITGNIVGGLHTASFMGRGQGILRNLTNYANVNASSSSSSSVDLMAAGVAGLLEAPGSGSGLINHGVITGKNRDVAGVVAVVNGDGNTQMTQLFNDGQVTGTIEVGGVGANFTGTTVDQAVNQATVTGTSNMVGGVLGWIHEQGSLTHAKNYGKVTGLLGVGGVAGRVGGVDLYDDYRFIVSQCLNAGEVIATSRNAGGIVGMTMDIEVMQCANVGNVTNTASSIKIGYAGAGGIVGLGVPNITDCYNAGTISACEEVGGILALNSNDTARYEIANCLNNGIVTGFTARKLDVGAVMGGFTEEGNPANATFNNVTYDVQLDTLAAVRNAGVSGVQPMLTRDIVEQLQPGDNWLTAQGLYPIPLAFADEPSVVVTRNPIILHAGDNIHRVTHALNLGTAQGYHWTSGDASTHVGSGTVWFDNNTTGLHELTVTDGTVSRTYRMTVNYKEACDINGDGIVDITDINIIINVILGKSSSDNYANTPDVNGDGVVDISDINIVVNRILGK